MQPFRRISIIRKKCILMLAEENGMPIKEEAFSMDELREADEVIVSSPGDLCIRAVELDGQPVGGKDYSTFKLLQDAYEACDAGDVK